ncbi:hypothetical protein AGMMS49975_28190 [Clostridia bacterium]|nr:hypothetical protein AGMMS49975_28190 [Clostridia bacterium]
MKIINLDLNSSVLKGNKEDAYECVRESFAVLEAANAVVESLKDWDATSNVSAETVSAVQLDNCEGLLNVLTTEGIDNYNTGRLSKVEALADRLPVVQCLRDQLVPILNGVVEAYVDLTDEEKTAVKELSIAILEQLSFFLYYEFAFDITTKSINENSEIEVHETVYDYVGRGSFSLEEKIRFMLEISIKYRPIIPSFDFTEEEIDNFYLNTGFSAYEILENIDDIDPKLVKQLAYGEITPEEVLDKLHHGEDAAAAHGRSKQHTADEVGVKKLVAFQ